jgi:hypothetical protein
MELPPLLSAKHIMFICSCSRSKAYDIMFEPHRIVWRNGKNVRLLKEPFLNQLVEESKPVKSA